MYWYICDFKDFITVIWGFCLFTGDVTAWIVISLPMGNLNIERFNPAELCNVLD